MRCNGPISGFNRTNLIRRLRSLVIADINSHFGSNMCL
jgi:hypothetical protein